MTKKAKTQKFVEQVNKEDLTRAEVPVKTSAAGAIAAELAEVRFQIDALTKRKEELMADLLSEVGFTPCVVDEKYKILNVVRNTVAYKHMVETLLPNVSTAPYTSRSESWMFKVLK